MLLTTRFFDVALFCTGVKFGHVPKNIFLFFLGECNVDIFCTICYIGKHIKEDYMRGICNTCVRGTFYYSGNMWMGRKSKFVLKKMYRGKVD